MIAFVTTVSAMKHFALNDGCLPNRQAQGRRLPQSAGAGTWDSESVAKVELGCR